MRIHNAKLEAENWLKNAHNENLPPPTPEECFTVGVCATGVKDVEILTAARLFAGASGGDLVQAFCLGIAWAQDSSEDIREAASRHLHTPTCGRAATFESDFAAGVQWCVENAIDAGEARHAAKDWESSGVGGFFCGALWAEQRAPRLAAQQWLHGGEAPPNPSAAEAFAAGARWANSPAPDEVLIQAAQRCPVQSLTQVFEAGSAWAKGKTSIATPATPAKTSAPDAATKARMKREGWSWVDNEWHFSPRDWAKANPGQNLF